MYSFFINEQLSFDLKTAQTSCIVDEDVMSSFISKTIHNLYGNFLWNFKILYLGIVNKSLANAIRINLDICQTVLIPKVFLWEFPLLLFQQSHPETNFLIDVT